MVETKLAKPKAIQAFEKRFKTEADHWGDVFYLRLASSWQDFFRIAFCFVNDGGWQEQNRVEVKNYQVSPNGVTFEGSFISHHVWGSDCLLVQGKIKTPSPNSLIENLSDGIYLLTPIDSDTGDFDGE